MKHVQIKRDEGFILTTSINHLIEFQKVLAKKFQQDGAESADAYALNKDILSVLEWVSRNVVELDLPNSSDL